jgi:DNA replication protein DnaC
MTCGLSAKRARITIFAALNLAYEEWAGFLGNKTMVDALLSRVRHYCHTVRIDGPSLREPQG